jgi:hypothetical protein
MRTLASMKMTPKLLLLCFLSTVIGLGQTLSTDQARRVHKVFIETGANGMPFDAVHLALSSTRIGWTDDRGSADLILKFDREVAHSDRSEVGNQIQIGIHWTYTLVASLPDGSVLYRDSASENFAPRSDKSEAGWVNYLRSTPEYTLTKKLASQLQK